MTEIKEYKSKRNGRIIVLDDYIYNFHKEMGDNIQWRCQERTCKCMCVTNKTLKFIRKTEHNHLVKKEKLAHLKVMNIIKNRVEKTAESSVQIKDYVLRNLDTETKDESKKLKSIIDRSTKVRNAQRGEFKEKK